MIALVVAVAVVVAAAEPVGLVEGEPAPFSGVLVDVDRAGELIELEARVKGLERAVEEERKLAEAWKAAATVEWFESPELQPLGGPCCRRCGDRRHRYHFERG